MTNMAQQPLFSIALPVYNGANYLREALDSIRAKTFRNVDLMSGCDSRRAQ